jgi:hypothetical protein
VTNKPQSSRSLNVQTYVDAQIIADLVFSFREQGIAHKSSYSHVVYQILKLVHADWGAQHFSTVEDSLDYLASEGFSLGQLKVPDRGEKTLRALNREAQTEPPAERASDLTEMLNSALSDKEAT